MEELTQFLRPQSNYNVRLNAVNALVELSNDATMQRLITGGDRKCLEALLGLLKDPEPAVCGKVFVTLINLVANDATFGLQLIKNYDVVPTFVEVLLDREQEQAGKSCMLLSNLTRTPGSCFVVLDKMSERSDTWLDDLLMALFTVDYNKKCQLKYLATFLANLTQLAKARTLFLDREKNHVSKLLSLLKCESSKDVVRRGGIASLIKNCCFKHVDHDWLLSDEVDILTHLLLPLTGGEEYPDEEMDLFPIDLQYLDADKQREPDADIRKLLVDCVTMLCARKSGRDLMRSKGVHFIIDNLLHFETQQGESEALDAAENLIQLLAAKEDEKVDNLLEDDKEKVQELS